VKQKTRRNERSQWGVVGRVAMHSGFTVGTGNPVGRPATCNSYPGQCSALDKTFIKATTCPEAVIILLLLSAWSSLKIYALYPI
jgi:hypothetical protein